MPIKLPQPLYSHSSCFIFAGFPIAIGIKKAIIIPTWAKKFQAEVKITRSGTMS